MKLNKNKFKKIQRSMGLACSDVVKVNEVNASIFERTYQTSADTIPTYQPSGKFFDREELSSKQADAPLSESAIQYNLDKAYTEVFGENHTNLTDSHKNKTISKLEHLTELGAEKDRLKGRFDRGVEADRVKLREKKAAASTNTGANINFDLVSPNSDKGKKTTIEMVVRDKNGIKAGRHNKVEYADRHYYPMANKKQKSYSTSQAPKMGKEVSAY